VWCGYNHQFSTSETRKESGIPDKGLHFASQNEVLFRDDGLREVHELDWPCERMSGSSPCMTEEEVMDVASGSLWCHRRTGSGEPSRRA
jgi:hypothetical protein